MVILLRNAPACATCLRPQKPGLRVAGTGPACQSLVRRAGASARQGLLNSKTRHGDIPSSDLGMRIAECGLWNEQN